MKKLLLAIIAGFCAVAPAQAQLTGTQKQELSAVNDLENSGFEFGKAGWAQSGGTFTIVSSGANLLAGKFSATFTASASGQYIQSKLYSPPKVGNCLARMSYRGGDTNWKLRVLDGSSTLIQEKALTVANSDSAAREFLFNFPCPTSGTYRLRLESTATAAQIAVDKMWLGEADNLVQISQTEFVGSISYAAASNCVWQRTSSSYGPFSADSDCNNGTLAGLATAPSGGKVPEINFASLKPGHYKVIVQGGFQVDSTGQCAYDIYDGSNAQGFIYVGGGAANQIIAEFDYSTPVSPSAGYAFRVQNKGNGSDACDIVNRGSPSDPDEFKISVYRYPSSNEIALRPDQIAWFVEAIPTGADLSLGTTSTSPAVGIADGSNSMQLSASPGSLPVEIPCSGTNPSSSATSCSGGNPQVGVVFTPPTSGKVEVCNNVPISIALSGGGGESVYESFFIAQTANNSQTSLVDSAEKGEISRSGTLNYLSSDTRWICGTFDVTAGTKQTFRLKYSSTITGSPTSNTWRGNQNSGSETVHPRWFVRPISHNVSAPLLVNSIVSTFAGVKKLVSATIDNNGSTASIQSQDGNWITSVNRTGAGNVAINIAAGTFSSQPRCWCNDLSSARWCKLISSSPTAANLASYDHTGSSTDNGSEIFCYGDN